MLKSTILGGQILRNSGILTMASFLLLFVTAFSSNGQALLYNFSQSSEPYVERTPRNNTGYLDAVDSDFGATQSLPFPFTFAGRERTHFSVSSNGGVYLLAVTRNLVGGFPPSLSLVSATGSGTDTVAALFPFVADLISQAPNAGGVSVFTDGTAPNRVAVIQISGWRFWASQGSPMVNFQVKLYEATGVVEYHYGNPTAAAIITNNTNVFVGWKAGGTTPLTRPYEFRTGTWQANSAERAVQTQGIFTNNRSFPSQGSIFRYTPTNQVISATNDLSIVAAINQPTTTTFCDNSSFRPMFTVRNTGTTSIVNPVYSMVVSGPGLTDDTVLLNSTETLIANQLDTITFPPVNLPTFGTYSIRVSSVTPDDNPLNSTRVFGRSITVDCEPMRYTFSQNVEPYVPVSSTTPILSGTAAGPATLTGATALPFPLVLNGVNYTQLHIFRNGYVRFGNTPGFNTTNVLNGASLTAAAFNLALNFQPATNTTSGVFSELQGTAPNRVLVIEWREMRNLTTVTTQNYNFQIRIAESGEISYHYGSMAHTGGLLTTQVGLRDEGTNFFLARGMDLINPTWDNSFNFTANASGTMFINPSTLPANGLKFTYAPDLTPFTDFSVNNIINLAAGTPFCDSALYHGSLIVSNRGNEPVANPEFRIRILRNGVQEDSVFFTSSEIYAPGVIDTLNFPSFTLPRLGGYTLIFESIVPNDIIAANNTQVRTAAITSTCRDVNYAFAQSSGTFNPVPTGTGIRGILGTGAFLAADLSENLALPFNFSLNGSIFNRIIVSRHGFVQLTNSPTDVLSNSSNVLNGFNINNIIAVYNDALNLGTDSIYYHLEGLAPNRVLTIEWRNMTTNTTPVLGNFNFQLKLEETTNRIQMVYGAMSYTGAQRGIQAGIRVQDTVFHMRAMNLAPRATNWENNYQFRGSRAGIMINATDVTIPSGLTFTFTPPPPPSEDAAVSGVFFNNANTNLCDSTLLQAGIIVQNRGDLPLFNFDVIARVVRPSGMVDSVIITVPSLPVAASDTIYTSDFLLPVAGTYPFQAYVRVINDGSPGNDRSAITNFTVNRNCSRAPYNYSTEAGVYTPLTSGVPLFTTGSLDNQNVNVTLPFPFFFNGGRANTVNINLNGYLVPNGTNNTTEGNPLSTVNNIIAPLGLDQMFTDARGLRVTTQVIGTAPNRRFVIQWDSLSLWDLGAVATTAYSYQAHLIEGTSNIEFHYNGFVHNFRDALPGIGIRINENVFTNLALPLGQTDWSQAVVAANLAQSIAISRTSLPTPGLIYRFVPTFVVPQNDAAVFNVLYSLTTLTNLCDSTTVDAVAIVGNNGAGAITNARVVGIITRPDGSRDSLSLAIPSLAVGEADTILFSNLLFPTIGNHSFQVFIRLAGDENLANNSFASITYAVDRNCSNAPFVYSTLNQTYTPITGGTPIFDGAGSLDNQNVVYAMPFPFFFNRERVNTLNINLNGYVVPNSTGNTTENGQLASINNAIAALGLDLIFVGSQTATRTITGTAPNRRLILQWDNVRRFGQTTTTDYSFQMHFVENSSVIEFHYGTFTHTAPLSTPNVGIRINANEFSALTLPITTNNWANAQIAANVGQTMILSSTITPNSGLVYRFVPTNLPLVNAQALGVLANSTTVCAGGTQTYRLRVRNLATRNLTDIPVRVTVRRPDNSVVVTNETITRNIAIDAIDTFALAAIPVSDTGTYSVGIRLLVPNDELTTNDSVSATFRALPLTPITFTAPTVCVGSRLVIRPNSPVTGSYFADDALTQLLGTGDSLVINSISGNQTIYFANGTSPTLGCIAPTSINITTLARPLQPFVVAAGDTVFCAGDSVTLTGPGGVDGYIWSNGAITRSITVRASGVFTLRTLNAAGCESNSSDPISVRVEAPGSAAPIVVTGANTFCAGDSVVLTAPTATSYLWSNGAITRSITVRTSGRFNVSLRTALGCESSPADSITVNVNALPEVPTLSFEGSTNTLSANDAAPAASYEWRRDGNILTGVTTRSFVVTENGAYTVVAISAAGCRSAQSATLVVTNAANRAMAAAINITPNPFVNELNIDLGTQAVYGNTIQITDLVGKVLATEKVEAQVAKLTINLSTLPTATYVVKISNANGTLVQRVVKQ